jgi:hypothetical protein
MIYLMVKGTYWQLSTVLYETLAGYEHLIADWLWHRQMLLPLWADTPKFRQIGRFHLPTTTGPEIRIILRFLQTKIFSVHCASFYAQSLYKCLMFNFQTSVHQCYSVFRQVVQTWSWHVASKHSVHKCMNQIIFFANIAIFENHLDKHTIAQLT